jgi:threonine dehydrogenase-like Zn-dependent dehydrogenase
VGLPDEYGALVEPFAVAQHGANRVSACADDKAVIFGAGPIGLALLLLLRYRGLKDVVVVDLSEKRLQLAASLGAHSVRGDTPDLANRLVEFHGTSTFFGIPMSGSTLYFEATGNDKVFETIIELAGPNSRVCLSGVHKKAVSLDLMMLLAREISIIPALGYADEFSEVLAILESGEIDPTVMISHRFPLSQIHAAFDAAQDAHSAIKVMVDCQA